MENLEEKLLPFEAQRNGTFLCSEDPWGRGKLARGGDKTLPFPSQGIGPQLRKVAMERTQPDSGHRLWV